MPNNLISLWESRESIKHLYYFRETISYRENITWYFAKYSTRRNEILK